MRNRNLVRKIVSKSARASLVFKNFSFLESKKSILGDHHPETLVSMNNLAVLYHGRGRYEEAQKLYEESLKHRNQIFGDKHPDTMTSMHNLAQLYESMKEGGTIKKNWKEKALKLYQDCYDRRVQNLGNNHPDTIRVKQDLERFQN